MDLRFTHNVTEIGPPIIIILSKHSSGNVPVKDGVCILYSLTDVFTINCPLSPLIHSIIDFIPVHVA